MAQQQTDGGLGYDWADEKSVGASESLKNQELCVTHLFSVWVAENKRPRLDLKTCLKLRCRERRLTDWSTGVK